MRSCSLLRNSYRVGEHLSPSRPHPKTPSTHSFVRLTSVNSVEPMSPNSSAPQLAKMMDLRGRQVPGEKRPGGVKGQGNFWSGWGHGREGGARKGVHPSVTLPGDSPLPSLPLPIHPTLESLGQGHLAKMPHLLSGSRYTCFEKT